MRILRHSIFALVIVSTILLYSICCSFLKGEETNFNIGITDFSGDRGYLNDIEISGIVADSKQKLAFQISDENITKSFTATEVDEFAIEYDNPFHENLSSCHRQMELQKDDIPADSSISSTISTDKVDVTYQIFKKKGAFVFKTDYIYKAKNKKILITYENGRITGSQIRGQDIGKDTLELNLFRKNEDSGKIYFFTSTGSDCAGFGGAYDITDELNTTYENDERIELENIAPIDLKDGDVRILGMDTAKNMLLFTTLEKGEVILKPFNLEKSDFMEDINLGSFPFACYEWVFGIGNFVSINNQYICFAFPIDGGNNPSRYRSFLCAVYDTETKKVVLKCTEKGFDNRVDFLHDIVMKYKNNKLYILRVCSTFNENIKYQNNILTKHLFVTVLGNEETLYQGLISTDINDDSLFKGDENDKLQSRIYMRDYYQLEIN